MSQASDLIPGQADVKQLSVFLYQRSTGTLSLVSHASGSPLGLANGDSGNGQISADGRWIAFLSSATNLIAGQAPTSSTSPYSVFLFLYDRISGDLRLASHTTASPLTPGTADSFAMSADGRSIAYVSAEPDLVPGQVSLGPGSNVFVYDRATNTTSLVSHNRDSAVTTPSSPGSRGPSLSADGRYIAYSSVAVDLVPHQTDVPNGLDVFVYDRTAGTTVLASHVRASLTTAANGASNFASNFVRISADGGVVAFNSFATDLAEGQVDPNGFQDAFLFERRSAEVTALSQRAPELPALTPVGPSSAADISADGRYVVFVSEAAGLVPGQVDTPFSIDTSGNDVGTWDVFLRDRATGKTTLVSRSKPSPPTTMSGFDPALSADGGFVAFKTVPNSQSGIGQLYLYNRVADSLTLVNHLPGSPTQSDGYPEVLERPALSADGRYVAYSCHGCHLVPGQPSGDADRQVDIFLYDRATGTNTLVSHASGSPATPGDRDSRQPRISADGRFVVFASVATNLVASQNGPSDTANVFVFDSATGAVTLVSHAAGSPATGAAGISYGAAFSADGRWIAFRSAATDLVPGQIDTNGVTDTFLYDRASGVTALVSHASSSPATAGNTDREDYGSEVTVALSADGRWIVFSSQAADLVPGVVNPGKLINVYLYDRLSGGVSLVSSAAGSPNVASWAAEPGISADGGRITFRSAAADLIPGQSSVFLNLFVQERTTGARLAARMLRKASYPGISAKISFIPRLSADGRFVAFTSDAQLTPGDLNLTWDAYLLDAAAVVPPPPDGPVQVPPCALFTGSLRSNARKVLKAAGSCGVPAGAKRVVVKVTVSQGTGQGNVQLYPGNVRTPAAGILRFERGATRAAGFDLPLSTNGTGTLALLPFVRGNGTVRVNVEIDAYVP